MITSTPRGQARQRLTPIFNPTDPMESVVRASTGQAGRIRTGMYQRDVGLLWPNPRPLPQEHVRRWHRVRWMISLRIDSETRRALQTHPMKNHQSLKGQPKKVHPRVHHWLPPRPLPQVRPLVHHWLLPQVRPRVPFGPPSAPPRPLPRSALGSHPSVPLGPSLRSPSVHLRLPSAPASGPPSGPPSAPPQVPPQVRPPPSIDHGVGRRGKDAPSNAVTPR